MIPKVNANLPGATPETAALFPQSSPDCESPSFQDGLFPTEIAPPFFTAPQANSTISNSNCTSAQGNSLDCVICQVQEKVCICCQMEMEGNVPEEAHSSTKENAKTIWTRRESNALSDIYNELGCLLDDDNAIGDFNLAPGPVLDTPSPGALSGVRGVDSNGFGWTPRAVAGPHKGHTNKNHPENDTKMDLDFIPKFLRSDSLASPLSPTSSNEDRKDRTAMSQFLEMGSYLQLPDPSAILSEQGASADFMETPMVFGTPEGTLEASGGHPGAGGLGALHAGLQHNEVRLHYCVQAMSPVDGVMESAYRPQNESDDSVIIDVDTLESNPATPAMAHFNAPSASPRQTLAPAPCDAKSLRRQKNNEACKRSRLKKKLQRDMSNQQLVELTRKNAELKDMSKRLSVERDFLKSALMRSIK